MGGLVAKSDAGRADLKMEHERKLEQFRQTAAGFQLQSTITGAAPRAMVDGQMIRVGDVIRAFRVEQISACGIVVERDGIRLQVSFQ